MMPTRIENLKLAELSFVDRPANPLAAITIFKRADTGPLPPVSPLLPASPLLKASARPARNEDEASARIDAAFERRRAAPRDDGEFESFDEACQALMRADTKLTRTAAMAEARRRYPGLYAAYQSSAGRERAIAVQKSDAVLKFERLVDSVQLRDRCGRLEALQKAARQHPVEREAYARAVT